jgi:acetyl-CoA acetyltransferase/uncharacterized OB-fold protein
VRLLPELTPANDWYWTSGSDGKLRIQGCTECDELVHPPAPICPRCRSTAWEPRVVSGRGTVAGYTVNSHPWVPGFDLELPYVVAVIALEEDPSVRVTSNVTGCEPDEVHIGQEVAVRFEQHEDVWLPLFEPTGKTLDNPVPEPVRKAPRAPLTTTRFEHDSVLSGIGRSQIGRRLMRDPLSLTVDACIAAVADAGLRMEDIDGLSTYPGMASMGMGEGGVTAVEEALRIEPTWHNGGGDIPGPGGSIIQAMLAVSAGLCRHVLCFRTVWESTFQALRLSGGGGPRMGGWMQWRMPYGAMSASQWIGMNANQYLHRYGATREGVLAPIALNDRANAGRNPVAIYRDPMTMDDYLSARPITTPFGLYDCDVPCDASIAVVVSAADAAADLPKPAIRIEAVGTQILERISWDEGTLTHEPQVIGQSTHLWTRTSMTPDDIDLAYVYDGFSFNAISWLEGLGFCGFGEAQDWLEGGKRIAYDGDLPVNTHGGQLSEGRTHGFGFFYEAITQLRGEGGDRQVPGPARTAVVTSGGGTPSGVLLLQRDGS